MLSRNGICYDLPKSKYISTQNGVKFFFSSKLYKEKFETRLEENRKTINGSLTKRFGIRIDVSTIADVVLYRKIEKRGFLIEVKEDKLQCLNNITFAGVTATMKNSNEQ